MYHILKKPSHETASLMVNGGTGRDEPVHQETAPVYPSSDSIDNISYSSLDTREIHNNNNSNDNDWMSYAPTEDFRSCTSGSGIFTVKSRAYRKTFLNGLSSSIYTQINSGEGFEGGYHEFTEKTSVLVLSVLAFFAYLALGVWAYSFYFEKWTIIDSLYFTVVTFTTCGYGDLVPDSDNGRLFTLFFIVIGISMLGGICLTILFENVFGAYEDMIEKARVKSTERYMKKSIKIADSNNYKSNSNSDSNSNSNEYDLRSSINIKESKDTMDSTHSAIDYELPSYWKEACDLWPFVLFIVAGAAYIGHLNDWDAITTAYFFTVTATSVGYGDLYPQSQTTKLISVVYIPCSVMIIAELFGRLIRVYLERKAHEAEEEFLNRRMTLADFNRMDVDKNGSVTYDEFIKFFLVTMGKVKEDEMDRMKELYDSFDVNNDGTLQVDDLVMMAKGKNDGTIGSILEF